MILTILSRLWQEQAKIYHGLNPVSQASLKCAISVILACYLALYFKLQYPFWAGVSVLSIMQFETGATFLKGRTRFLATCYGALLGFGVISLSIDYPILFMFLIFLVVLHLLYQSAQSVEQNYFWILASATFIMIVSGGFFGETKKISELTFYRIAEVSLGIIAAWIISYLFPQYTNPSFEETQIRLINEVKKIISLVIVNFNSEINIETSFSEVHKSFLNLIAKQTEQFRYLSYESFLTKASYHKTIYFIESLNNVVNILAKIYKIKAKFNNHHYNDLFENEWTSVNHALKKMIEDAHDYIIGITSKKQVEQLLRDFEQIFSSIIVKHEYNREKKYNLNYPISTVVEFYQIIALVNAIFAQIKQSIEPIDFKIQSQQTLKNSKEIWIKKLKINDLYYLKYSFKGTLAILSIPFVWLGLELPNIQQIGISVLAILQVNFEGTREKGRQRIWGCVFGGITAILLLGLNITHLSIYLLFCGMMFYLLAYINFSFKEYNHFANQAGVAFLIGTFSQAGPSSELMPVIARLSGILAGVLMLQYIFILWPMSRQEKVIHLNNLIRSHFHELSQVLWLLFSKRQKQPILPVNYMQNFFKKNEKIIKFYEDVFIGEDINSHIKERIIDLRLDINAFIFVLENDIIYEINYIKNLNSILKRFLITLKIFVKNDNEIYATQQIKSCKNKLDDLIQSVRNKHFSSTSFPAKSAMSFFATIGIIYQFLANFEGICLDLKRMKEECLK